MPSKKEKWIDSLQLPKDVCMGALRVTLTGNSEAWIENYRGILEYTGERILLAGQDLSGVPGGNQTFHRLLYQ